MQSGIPLIIDEFSPCLKEPGSDIIHPAHTHLIKNREDLKTFREEDGWELDWDKLPGNVDVYALRIDGDSEVQGLIGISRDYSARAAFVHCAVEAPYNNLRRFNTQRYEGIAGMLFCTAACMSRRWGYGGLFHGFAADDRTLRNYVDFLQADALRLLHPHHFMVDEDRAKELEELCGAQNWGKALLSSVIWFVLYKKRRYTEKAQEKLLHPLFMEKQEPMEGYTEHYDPYKMAPVCRVNLLEMSRFAAGLKKDMADMDRSVLDHFTDYDGDEGTQENIDNL